MPTLLLALVALSQPSLASPPTVEAAEAVLVDGAKLDWGDHSYTCDGERVCVYDLDVGPAEQARTRGQVRLDVEYADGTSSAFVCAAGACTPTGTGEGIKAAPAWLPAVPAPVPSTEVATRGPTP